MRKFLVIAAILVVTAPMAFLTGCGSSADDGSMQGHDMAGMSHDH